LAVGVPRYYDVHPQNPQPRPTARVVQIRRHDGVIAYPTDTCYALGCRMDNQSGLERIRRIRGHDERHHMTLVCADFAQLGQLVHLDNAEFRAVKAATPGPYTFILPATKEVPRRLSHPKKRTVGIRLPDNPVVKALLTELGEPILSSTLILKGSDEPMTDGWTIKEELDHQVDAVLDAGECGAVPSTVIDWSEGYPEVVRVGVGDPTPFE
jgi:tRNA threonylcarbamoyl adenosine modification protein (Sua5/YciO/YrdC/YwlC family)